MKKEKICGIYKITSPTGKIYIGESYDIERRFKNYNNLRCKAQIKLYNSLLKYSPDRHIFTIIEECNSEDLKCKERYWQDFYNVLSKNGLNLKLTKCGELKMIHSEETRMKISDSKKELYKDLSVSKRMSTLFKEKGISRGDKNPNAKFVINYKTKSVLSCALYLSEYLNINYSTLIGMLNGNNSNRTDWCFLEDYYNGTYKNNLQNEKYPYKGVHFVKRKNKWCYRLTIANVRITIGMYKTKEEALEIKKLSEDNIEKFENKEQFKDYIKQVWNQLLNEDRSRK